MGGVHTNLLSYDEFALYACFVENFDKRKNDRKKDQTTRQTAKSGNSVVSWMISP